jgi:hypothetical protein
MYSNRVMITGFLGNHAESRTTRNNTSFTTFSVATKPRWKNRETGEYESQTTWLRSLRRHAESLREADVLLDSAPAGLDRITCVPQVSDCLQPPPRVMCLAINGRRAQRITCIATSRRTKPCG